MRIYINACGFLTAHVAVQSQASLFWAVSRMGLRPSEALLDKASLVLQQKDIQAQARLPNLFALESERLCSLLATGRHATHYYAINCTLTPPDCKFIFSGS